MGLKRSARPGPPADASRTIRLDLSYDGRAYVGWQRQKNGRAVQECLETALSKVAHEEVTLFGASRTDAGVHARRQVASFSLRKSKTPVEAFRKGVNTLLPADIRVQRATEAELWFHAGADAIKKTYRYFWSVGDEPSVFLRNYSWHLRSELNLEKMKTASEFLVGTHDFAAFRTRGTKTKTTTRTILSATFASAPFHLLYFEIVGEGFLKQMVRNITGTLVEIGQGKRPVEDVPRILSSGDRRECGVTAPAHGLFLWGVEYGDAPACQRRQDLE